MTFNLRVASQVREVFTLGLLVLGFYNSNPFVICSFVSLSFRSCVGNLFSSLYFILQVSFKVYFRPSFLLVSFLPLESFDVSLRVFICFLPPAKRHQAVTRPSFYENYLMVTMEKKLRIEAHGHHPITRKRRWSWA